MRAIAVAIVAIGLSLSAVPVYAVDVFGMSYRDVDKWVAQPPRELRKTLSNKTIRIDVTSRAVGKHRPVLGTGSLILFAAAGGKLLWWTPKYKTVQTGSWSSETLMPGWELPCFKFDTPVGRSSCYFGGAANYKEWTAGNPFGLKAGAAPAGLSGRASLAAMAKKMGL